MSNTGSALDGGSDRPLDIPRCASCRCTLLPSERGREMCNDCGREQPRRRRDRTRRVYEYAVHVGYGECVFFESDAGTDAAVFGEARAKATADGYNPPGDLADVYRAIRPIP